jgi:hypothetical protein
MEWLSVANALVGEKGLITGKGLFGSLVSNIARKQREQELQQLLTRAAVTAAAEGTEMVPGTQLAPPPGAPAPQAATPAGITQAQYDALEATRQEAGGFLQRQAWEGLESAPFITQAQTALGAPGAYGGDAAAQLGTMIGPAAAAPGAAGPGAAPPVAPVQPAAAAPAPAPIYTLKDAYALAASGDPAKFQQALAAVDTIVSTDPSLTGDSLLESMGLGRANKAAQVRKQLTDVFMGMAQATERSSYRGMQKNLMQARIDRLNLNKKTVSANRRSGKYRNKGYEPDVEALLETMLPNDNRTWWEEDDEGNKVNKLRQLKALSPKAWVDFKADVALFKAGTQVVKAEEAEEEMMQAVTEDVSAARAFMKRAKDLHWEALNALNDSDVSAHFITNEEIPALQTKLAVLEGRRGTRPGKGLIARIKSLQTKITKLEKKAQRLIDKGVREHARLMGQKATVFNKAIGLWANVPQSMEEE